MVVYIYHQMVQQQQQLLQPLLLQLLPGGSFWTLLHTTSQGTESIASDSTGNYLAAVNSDGTIYTSSDS